MGVLKVKIKLLYKTYSEWNKIKDTYIPLKGEMCVCEIPTDNDKTILFKIGNGKTVFNGLPWSSALASDVYAWAKKESLDWDDLSEDFKEDLVDYLEEQGGIGGGNFIVTGNRTYNSSTGEFSVSNLSSTVQEIYNEYLKGLTPLLVLRNMSADNSYIIFNFNSYYSVNNNIFLEFSKTESGNDGNNDYASLHTVKINKSSSEYTVTTIPTFNTYGSSSTDWIIAGKTNGMITASDIHLSDIQTTIQSASNNYLVSMDSNGKIQNSYIYGPDVLTKASNITNNNLIAADSNGKAADSNISISSITALTSLATASNNGKVLTIVNGQFAMVDITDLIPDGDDISY